VYDSLWLMSIVFEYGSHFNDRAFHKAPYRSIQAHFSSPGMIRRLAGACV
jgi:hypothetical protein